MEANPTRNEIIRVGLEIIAQQGFGMTGLDTILKKAKVPKGSFYYYFPSKDDFGLAVIDQFSEQCAERMDSHLGNLALSPLLRLRGYFESGVSQIAAQGCKRGCLVGNLSLELSTHEKFRKRLEEVFGGWKRRFTECLQEAQKSGQVSKKKEPAKLAEFLLCGWEGAILRAKVMKSPKPMEEFIEMFFDPAFLR